MTYVRPTFTCVSVDVACFRGSKETPYEDKFALLCEIQKISGRLVFPVIDVGPYEAFVDYSLLLAFMHNVQPTGFRVRLLTSGKYFADAGDTIKRFRELRGMGVWRFVLRLDEVSAAALENDNLLNFIDGCAAMDLTADILLELEGGTFPDWALQLARRIEELRFYNNIFVHKRVPITRRPFRSGQDRAEDLDRSRLVVFGDGFVCLRKRHAGALIVDVEVGDLTRTQLSDVVQPNRFY